MNSPIEKTLQAKSQDGVATNPVIHASEWFMNYSIGKTGQIEDDKGVALPADRILARLVEGQELMENFVKMEKELEALKAANAQLAPKAEHWEHALAAKRYLDSGGELENVKAAGIEKLMAKWPN